MKQELLRLFFCMTHRFSSCPAPVRVVILLICLAGLTAPAHADSSQPNFILIVLDDWGAEDAGTYGNLVVKTPTMDAMAKEGVRFDQAFLTTSSCTASRASILTGLYPSQSGAPKLHDALPPSSVLVTDLLRESGYYTASAGKFHIGDTVHDHFDAVTDNPDPSGAGTWLQTLEERPKDKPFFFWFAAKDPHVPYGPITPESVHQISDIKEVSPFMADSEGSRLNIAQYYNEINRTDQNIATILDYLEKEGLADNTFVFLFSDNGAPFPRAKTTLYDSGIKTPLIVIGPDVVTGQINKQLISSIDIVPTVLELANTPAHSKMPGISFKDILMGKNQAPREYIYAEQYNHGFSINKQAIRTEKYLYIKNNLLKGHHCLLEADEIREDLVAQLKEQALDENQMYCFTQKRPPEELYNVDDDPLSLVNLVDSWWHRPTLNGLRAKMAKHPSLPVAKKEP